MREQEEKLARLREQVIKEEKNLLELKEKSKSEILKANNILQDCIFEFKKAEVVSRLVGAKRRGGSITSLQKMLDEDLKLPEDDPNYSALLKVFAARPN